MDYGFNRCFIFSYGVDIRGNWVGSSQFRFSDAVYELDLTGFNISSMDQYEDMMGAFYRDIQRIGQAAKSMNLASNLILWTAYSRYYSVESKALDTQKGGQRFQMTGATAQVFDLSLQTARVLGPFGYRITMNFTHTTHPIDQCTVLILCLFNLYVGTVLLCLTLHTVVKLA